MKICLAIARKEPYIEAVFAENIHLREKITRLLADNDRLNKVVARLSRELDAPFDLRTQVMRMQT